MLLLLQSTARSTTAGSNFAAPLTWGASSDPNVAGYHIYFGTASHSYSSMVAVGNVAAVSIPGLNLGTTYYFAVTSVDNMGDESDFSNEVSYSVPTIPTIPTTPLTSTFISGNGQFGLSVTGIAGNQYVVEASTDLINWVALQTNTAPFSFIDTNTAGFSQRFFYVTNL